MPDLAPRDAMIDGVLGEIARALDVLATNGTPHAIDLRGLDLGQPFRDGLAARLGRGEVSVTLTGLGRSDIWETAFPGVWWVRHFGQGEHPLTERIEVAPVPDLLAAAPDDIAAAAARLAATLAPPHEVPHGQD